MTYAQIVLSPETVKKIGEDIENLEDRLKELKEKHNVRLIKDTSERTTCKIFEEHASEMGFSDLREVDGDPELYSPTPTTRGPGDYVCNRGSERVRIEIESGLSSFFTHQKYIQDMIDVVVALDEGWGINDRKKNELMDKEVILLEDFLEVNFVPKGAFLSFLYSKDEEFKKEVDEVVFGRSEREKIEEIFGK